MPAYISTEPQFEVPTGARYVLVASDGTITEGVTEGWPPPIVNEASGVVVGMPLPSVPVYLVEISAHNGTEVVTLRYATSGVVVGGYYYEPRVVNPGSIRAMLFGEGTTFGASSTGYGEIVLVNSDGALDPLIGYGQSGRDVMIKRFLAGVVTLLAACTGEQATVTTEQVALRVKDPSAVFSAPVQTNKYNGTNSLPNGVDGTDDIKGKEKPLVFGTVYNVAPTLVNTSRLIYQASDGVVAALPAVYDKGVKLAAGSTYTSQADMEANAPAAGEYRAWLSGGMFRLGSSPVGQITCDAVEGATAADRTAAQVAKRIALRKLASGALVTQDFTDLDALNAAEVGIYINGNTTYRAALDDVLGSIGGWWSFDTGGKLNVGRLDAPAGTPAMSLTGAEALSLDRVATNDAGRGVPAYQVNLDYQKNYTVQPAGSLAGSVPNISAAAWIPSTFPVSGNWYDIAYGNGQYVAVLLTAEGNNLAVSSDGKAWRMLSAAQNGSTVWTTVSYINGKFILTAPGAGKVAYSTNLTTWTVSTLPSTGYWSRISYGNGVYVVTSTDKCATSTDLLTWTSRTIPAGEWASTAFGNGRFVTVSINSNALWSYDGVVWNTVVTPMYTNLVSFVSGVFVTLSTGTTNTVYYSNDGVSWLTTTLPIAGKAWPSITVGNGAFVLFSPSDGVNRLLVSTDGKNWVESSGPVDRVYDMALMGQTTVFMLKLSASDYSYATLSANPTQSQFVGTEYRSVTATDTAVLTQHINAPAIDVQSLIVSPAAAQTEATRLLNLYKVRRDYIVVTCKRSALITQLPALGKTVKLTYPRFGYDSGKLFTFLGYEQHIDTDEVTLYLWG